MWTSRTPIALALVLAGCSAARQPTVAVPAAAPTAALTVQSTPMPLAGVPARYALAGRGMRLSRGVGHHGALTLTADSGPREDVLEMRLTLGLRYAF